MSWGTEEQCFCYFLQFMATHVTALMVYDSVGKCYVGSRMNCAAPWQTHLPSLSLSPPSLPPLSLPVTWPRIPSCVTVTWSGWQTTCSTTPLRPVGPAAATPEGWRTNASARLKARSSGAQVRGDEFTHTHTHTHLKHTHTHTNTHKQTCSRESSLEVNEWYGDARLKR